MSEKFYSKLKFLCWITIICCSIIKFFGYNEFEIPLFNYEINVWIRRIVNCSFFAINGLCFSAILLKHKLKIKEFIVVVLISIFDYVITFNMASPFYLLVDLLCYFTIGLLFVKEWKWFETLLECIVILVVFALYQGLTTFYKNFNLIHNSTNLIGHLVLDIDYYCLIILTIMHEFKRGGLSYGRRWKTFLVILSKQKGIKQLLATYKTSILQRQKTNDGIGFAIFIVMLSICQIALVGTFCYFINNVIIEYLMIFVSFVIMREYFGKSYHSDSVLSCTTLSIFVFVLATRLSLPIWLSILCNVLIGCLVAYIMHVLYFYKEYSKNKNIKLYRGMERKDLIKLCDDFEIVGTERKILIEFYVDKHRIDYIARLNNYSSDNIKKIKANILNKIENKKKELI